MALKALSNNNVLLHEDLLKQPYQNILLELWTRKEESDYTEKLRKVLEKRAKKK